MKLIEYKPKDRIYEIYINKYGKNTPCNFYTIIKVLNEFDDKLIDMWCHKTFGNLYQLNKNDIFKAWHYKLIEYNISTNEKMIIIKNKEKK